jgi:hypothetical protein
MKSLDIHLYDEPSLLENLNKIPSFVSLINYVFIIIHVDLWCNKIEKLQLKIYRYIYILNL